MTTRPRTLALPLGVLGAMAFVYFVVFPQDLTAVKRVLALSSAVSPALYGLIAIAILCWTAVRIWGTRPGATAGTIQEQPSR